MAWGLSDLVALMDRWKDWQEVRQAAQRVPELERRIAALEERLEGGSGESCPSCGKPFLRVVASKPDPELGVVGARRHQLRCSECGFRDEKLVHG